MGAVSVGGTLSLARVAVVAEFLEHCGGAVGFTAASLSLRPPLAVDDKRQPPWGAINNGRVSQLVMARPVMKLYFIYNYGLKARGLELTYNDGFFTLG